jgi:hypothetical protein
MTQPLATPVHDHLQVRHTIAAAVYFIYGICYLFGAQYLTSMQSTQRAMSNPKAFFILGGIIAIAFPILIYRRTGIGISFLQRASGRYRSYQVSFTLLLGLFVCARVAALLRGGLYLKSPLHTIALVLAAVNAAFLLWAGSGQAWWRVEASGSAHAAQRPPGPSTGSRPWAS